VEAPRWVAIDQLRLEDIQSHGEIIFAALQQKTCRVTLGRSSLIAAMGWLLDFIRSPRLSIPACPRKISGAFPDFESVCRSRRARR
jgi:hypothetical protein